MKELLKLLKSLTGDSSTDEPVDAAAMQPPPLESLVDKQDQAEQAAERSTGTKILDSFQAVGDVAGVIDQTGIVDGLNAMMSAMRAMTSKDKSEKNRHWKDAGIRAVSMVPIVGDMAKTARTGRYMDEVGDVASFFKKSQVDEVAEAGKAETAAATAGETAAKQSFWESAFPTFRKHFSRDEEQEKPAETIAENPYQAPDYGQMTGFAGSDGVYETESMLPPTGGNEPPQAPPHGPAPGSPDDGRGPDDMQPQGVMSFVKNTLAEIFQPMEDIFEGIAEKDGKKVLGAFGKIAVAVTAALPLINRFGESMVESRRQVAMYNGTTAAELAQVDLQKIQLDMQYAQNTSVSSQRMMETYREFREDYQPLRELGGNVANEMGSIVLQLSRLVASAVDGATQLTQVVSILNWWFDWEKNKDRDKQDARGQAFLDLMGGRQQNGNPFQQGQRQPLGDL